ncbi:MAG: hypothetical protein Q8907_02285 [Bacteroidota bacterium]|nr:hypothetical protein [Bacteroidota bacterium]
MVTFKELATEYYERLKKSYNPVSEFEQIIKDIKGLVYTSNEQPLSNEDRAKIVFLIIGKFESKHTKFLSETESEPLFDQQDIQNAFSNDNYLALINYIKTRTK